VQGAPSFNLQANDIRLEGFVIQNSPNLGVNTSSSFSGYQILSNLVQNYGVAGINLLSGGAKQSRVSDNCLRSAFSDTVAHEGMESEVGPLLKNARADHNVGTGNDVFIDASGAGMRMNVAFDHNKSMGNNIGFLISNSTDSSIDHNSSQGDGNGVNMGGSNNGLKTTHNSVVSSQGSGITLSNSNSVPTFTGPNTGVEISHNSVTDSARGIRILADSTFVNSEIGHNDTFANALFGILLEAGDSNTIDHNSANDNGDTGIYNQTGSGNLFLNNSMFGNGVFDARDDNRASNTWSGNHCNTDSPPGTICGV
jgi:parallel beta-helix repeat protein